MTSEKSRGTSLNNRLAKAETVLLLALITEMLLNPWLFRQTQLAPWHQTLIKMAIVVGCFGPVFNFVTYLIDGSLTATRTVTTSILSLPRCIAHALLLGALFLGFYWFMHHSLPWRGMEAARTATTERTHPINFALRGQR